MTIWTPTLSSGKPTHIAISEALAEDIAAGRLVQGERLPTQRELAQRLGLSLGTITRAYDAARRRGLIRGETGRGTFVGKRGGEDLFDPDTTVESSDAQLDVTWPLYAHDPDLAAALVRISESAVCKRLLRYQPNAGMPHHREAGALWARGYGVDVEPDRFSAALIPHTLSVTTLGKLAVGDHVNLETDLLAKYVQKQLQYLAANAAGD
ncbi:MAG: GntR family transcriptional regulator, partial [Candidatus Krumholzibacteriota bacterium]|nr:GntR family transcriptional regulator [Candidatus Krumholzibacteriota bacterium]